MEFEWDERKRQQNILKHGIDFVRATEVFLADHFSYESENSGNDQERYVAVGQIDDGLYAVIYTYRGEVIRIISARRARYEEKRKYRQLYARGD